MVAPPAPVAPALSGIPPSLLKRYRSERPQISTPDFISLSVSFCRGQRDLYKLTYERWFETRWEYFDPNGKEFATRATAHDADDDEPLAPLPGGRYSCTEIAASPGAETTPQSDES